MEKYWNISKNGVKWTFNNNWIDGFDFSNEEPLFAVDADGNFISMHFDGVYIAPLNKARRNASLEIKQVIFNNPATVIKWADGTKTIAKASNEEFDEEKGFAMAYLKKVFGGGNQYMKYVKNAKRQEKKLAIKDINKCINNTALNGYEIRNAVKTIEDVTNEINRKDILVNKVINIIAEQLGYDVNDISFSSNVIDDLGADSLDIVELLMALEDEFDIEISDEEAEKVKLIVCEIINMVIKKSL